MPVAERLAKRNRAVKAVAKEVNDLAAVGRAVLVDAVPVGVALVDAVPVDAVPVGVAQVVPVAVVVTTVFPMNRQMNFPKRFCASTVRPRWSRAVADSALAQR